jgi:hypothetical protein
MNTTTHTGVNLRRDHTIEAPPGVSVLKIEGIYKDAFGDYRGTVTVESDLKVRDTSQDAGYDWRYDGVSIYAT